MRYSNTEEKAKKKMQMERLKTQEVQNWQKKTNDKNAGANKETRIEKRGLRERVH